MRCSQAQSTAAALIGTAFGVALSPWALTSSAAVLSVFAPLALGTQLAAYRSSSVVSLNTFNLQRAEIAFSEFQATGLVLTPEDASAVESFVLPYRSLIRVNPGLTPDLLAAVDQLRVDRFWIKRTSDEISLWVAEGATAEEAVRGVFEACTTGQSWAAAKVRFEAQGWQLSVAFVDDPFTRLTIL